MYALEKNNNQAADCSNTQCPRVELDKEDRNPNQTATLSNIHHTSKSTRIIKFPHI